MKIKQSYKINTYIQIGFFLLFCITYIYLMLYGEDFAYHDNEQYTLFSLSGNFLGMPIHPSGGRFWPLGHQEFNLISLFSKTPLAYHLFPVFQLVVCLCVIWLILENKSISYKLFVIFFIMITHSFVISFQGLIFPERNLIFWISILILSIQKFEKSNSIIYFIGAIIAAQFLLYYKEPIFLLIGGFATMRLVNSLVIIKIWSNWGNLSKVIKYRWIDVSLIILSIIFLSYYFLCIFPNIEDAYMSNNQVNTFSIIVSYLTTDIILNVFFIVFFVRIIYLGKIKKNPDMLWDFLAFSSILYFISYIKLGMYSTYYTSLTDFIAILYLAILIDRIDFSNNKSHLKKSTIIALTFLLCLENIHLSSYAIISRKKHIDSRVKFVQFIQEYIYNHPNGNDLGLFFPHNNNYDVMQFTAFMNYKINQGSNFSDITDTQLYSNGQKLVLKNYLTEKLDKDLCVSYRNIKCYYQSKPSFNDLIIYLPASDHLNLYSQKFDGFRKYIGSIRKKELIDLGSNSKTLFHYQPMFEGLEKILVFLSPPKWIDSDWLNGSIMTQNPLLSLTEDTYKLKNLKLLSEEQSLFYFPIKDRQYYENSKILME
ncbi:hypothetical protein VB715_03895 [Crocosphaera sp. UHCC 0190]|uniref:hypothetical protein n=1 Tax=Crocosphaera sp. UHCC 0190 TaxID=3110246 RepID=UPI002B1EB796|nr:hypothetical protein [Crocosphaera sp. UHCC 0190]MEA5508898.1 hypothetical protein [Crocosphaera sp. UHCC 0190]